MFQQRIITTDHESPSLLLDTDDMNQSSFDSLKQKDDRSNSSGNSSEKENVREPCGKAKKLVTNQLQIVMRSGKEGNRMLTEAQNAPQSFYMRKACGRFTAKRAAERLYQQMMEADTRSQGLQASFSKITRDHYQNFNQENVLKSAKLHQIARKHQNGLGAVELNNSVYNRLYDKSKVQQEFGKKRRAEIEEAIKMKRNPMVNPKKISATEASKFYYRAMEKMNEVQHRLAEMKTKQDPVIRSRKISSEDAARFYNRTMQKMALSQQKIAEIKMEKESVPRKSLKISLNNAADFYSRAIEKKNLTIHSIEQKRVELEMAREPLLPPSKKISAAKAANMYYRAMEKLHPIK